MPGAIPPSATSDPLRLIPFSLKQKIVHHAPDDSDRRWNINVSSRLARDPPRGMAPVLIPLRPSSEALLRARVPGAPDQRGCPFQAFSLRAFRLFTPLRGRPGRSSSARVERAPSERARSASRRTTRPPPLSPLEWGMQFLLCCQHFPACLSSVLTLHALQHQSLRAIVEELIYESIASEIPFFLVIRLVSPLRFIRSNCHSHKETHHVLINFHHALQPPSLHDAGRRATDETGPTSRALITRAVNLRCGEGVRNHCLGRECDLPELPPHGRRRERGRASLVQSIPAPGTAAAARR